MDDMKKCPKCGADNAKDAAVCVECGAAMDTGNGTGGGPENPAPVAGIEKEDAETPGK